MLATSVTSSEKQILSLLMSFSNTHTVCVHLCVCVFVRVCICECMCRRVLWVSVCVLLCVYESLQSRRGPV